MGAEHQLLKRLINSVGELMPSGYFRLPNRVPPAAKPMATRKYSNSTTAQDKFAEWIQNGVYGQFQAATDAIINGQCPPTLAQLKKRYQMGHAVAKAYLAELENQGLLHRNSQGRYELLSQHRGMERGFKKLVQRYQAHNQK